MTWKQEYKYWFGHDWTCPDCDAETEPFEDNSVCEKCHYEEEQ